MSRTRRSVGAALLILLGLALLIVACDSEPSPTIGPVATPTPETTPEVRIPAVALLIDDDAERARMEEAVAGGGFRLVDSEADAEIVLADRPIEGGEVLLLEAWAAVTDQRRDVLELDSENVRAILAGDATDWSAFGGTGLPITTLLPSDSVERVAAAFGLRPDELTRVVEREDLASAVAEQPGAFALLPAAELRPGVLALIVDGHDPYRDAERDSPLRFERWVRSADSTVASRLLEQIGWTPPQLDFHPVGLLATGEILPVRCTYEQLRRRGDYGAMFDGTRHLMQAADLVFSQLDAALSDRQPPSPCVSTFDLRAPTAIAEALAEAGIDVMSTGTNHHMDCPGCAAQAHFDIVGALEDAGILNVGSGENLEAARQPAFIERGGIRLAFLGYDAIARDWYGATAATPGTAPLGWDTLDSLAEDVARAKAEADHVIVGFSWSYIEYVTNPDDLQRAAAHVIAEAGGSLIVGNGPHIVQASEMIGDMFVAYSLGNFIYDQDWTIPPGSDGLSNYETIDNILLEVGFTSDRLIGYRVRPAVIRETHRPELVDPAGEEGQRILQRLWNATDALPEWTGAGAP